jgi:hypothetical protein
MFHIDTFATHPWAYRATVDRHDRAVLQTAPLPPAATDHRRLARRLCSQKKNNMNCCFMNFCAKHYTHGKSQYLTRGGVTSYMSALILIAFLNNLFTSNSRTSAIKKNLRMHKNGGRPIWGKSICTRRTRKIRLNFGRLARCGDALASRKLCTRAQRSRQMFAPKPTTKINYHSCGEWCLRVQPRRKYDENIFVTL